MTIQERLETVVLRAALRLPPLVQRGLAGRAVVRDGQTLAVDTQVVLRLERIVRMPGAADLSVPEARLLTRKQTRMVSGRQPIGAVRDLHVAGLPARLYTPSSSVVEEEALHPSPSVVEEEALHPSPSVVEEVAQQPSPSVVEEVAQQPSRNPLLVFFHGGGFFVGDLDTHDGVCRFVAERSGVAVLAVDYRLAPEEPFPAAYDDALAAYRWVVDHVDELGADPSRLAVGGDSAGGNLAAVVAIEAARAGLPLAFQLLVYPVADADRSTASAAMFNHGFFLTQEFLDLMHDRYVGGRDVRDPRISPEYADLPAGLAPAYVVTAGFDPLRDEGEAYARRLAEAGGVVEVRRFPDQIHGFFNVLVARTSRAAVAEIAVRLRAGLTRT